MSEAIQELPHILRLDSRETLTLTGVTDVDVFEENEAVVQTTGGTLTVHGSGLRMGQFSTETGDMTLTGTVRELVYSESLRREGLFRRLFR